MSDLWSTVNRLLDGYSQLPPETLVAHGVGLLAAQRCLATGRPLPPLLRRERELAIMLDLAGRSLLGRVRALLDGPIVLIKGPELATYYPDTSLRSFGDLDLLVMDSARAKAVLLAAGFEECDDYEFDHTQRPIQWPGTPLAIELHHRLPWLHWMSPPRERDYLAAAVPSRTGIPGISTLPPADHALLIAAHAWHHAPLRRLGDLIDVAAIADGQDAALLRARARELRMERLWVTTRDATQSLLDGTPRLPRLLRAGHLHPLRERTVLEVHAARWAGALWAPTLTGKARSLATTAREDLRPLPGEPWPEKLARTGRALVDAHAPALLRQRYPSEP